MKQYFTSRGYVDGGVLTNLNNEHLDMAALPGFLRTLLVTDGTVTKSLEAYFWEPVAIDLLWQRTVWLHAEKPLIDAAKGDQVLKRSVRLRGEKTAHIYAYATSFLKTGHLPDSLNQQLLAGEIGIGEILREVGLETYREIMDFGQAPLGQITREAPADSKTETAIYRTYRIVAHGDPVMQITESFPCLIYGLNSAAPGNE